MTDRFDRPDHAAQRQALYGLLGELPPRDGTISARVVRRESREHFELEVLSLDLNGQESVPAYFLTPRRSEGPLPVVLFHHAHGDNYVLGKDEVLTGRPAQQQPPFGEALTRAGYAVLCTDMWNFGDRRGRTESALFKELLWKGRVLWGLMVYDSLRSVDYLASRPDVDMARIATMGMSLGSTMAWWTAALDTRIKVCIDICCMTDFQALIDSGGLDGHGIYYYVPKLLQHFTTAQINALIAPRPHLSLAGNHDRLTPRLGLDRIDAALRDVYRDAGAADAWRMLRYEVGHIETAEMRAEALAFLTRWL
ncbi:MAG: dienelactone hydrolase family protein [Chloroflexota bacterium]